MSEFAQILKAVEDFKVEIKQDIFSMCSDIKEIKTVLAGDKFGNEGLVNNHQKTVEKLYRLRDEVKTMKVVGSVLYSIIGIIIGTIAYFSKH